MLIMLNCHNLPHTERYERFDAFFDLDRDKHEKERAMIYSHATCCVLSYADITNKSGDVKLSYWQYRQMFESEEYQSWVLVGVKIGEFTMSKAELVDLPEFAGVIASDGDFNQFSVKPGAK